MNLGRASPVKSLPKGATPEGIYDLAKGSSEPQKKLLAMRDGLLKSGAVT